MTETFTIGNQTISINDGITTVTTKVSFAGAPAPEQVETIPFDLRNLNDHLSDLKIEMRCYLKALYSRLRDGHPP